MSEPKLISPLLDGFIVGEPISEQLGVRCYPAIRTETDEQYMLKIISIPASQTRVDALLLSGAYGNSQEVLAYFEELAQSTISELNILSRLSKIEGFLPFTDHQLVTMDDGVGFELYLLSPYRQSLERLLQQAPFTHLGAVNLALDLCAALSACRRAGYLFTDLTPGNVFLTETQGWRIGDLGFLPLASVKYASLHERYWSRYTAPEIQDALSELNASLDVYALGLILYQVYNNGELPAANNAAQGPFPPPQYADYEIAEILLKACDPDPRQRWQDPSQMGQAIVNYMQRNDINDVSLIPAPVELPAEPEPDEGFLSDDENERQLAALMSALLPEEPPIADPAGTEDVPTAPPDPDTDLSFMNNDAGDETVPSEDSVSGLQGTPVTDEVAQMLAQADDLISHELPDPAVAPDPIDVPFPAPIVLTDEDNPDATPEDEPVTPVSNAPDPIVPEEPGNHGPVPDDSDDGDDEDKPYTESPSDKVTPVPKPTKKIIISIVSVIAITVALILGGYLYYNQIYLQTVRGLTVTGTVDTIDVIISSDIKDELLTVYCTDTYGNLRKASVSGGKATFTDLNSNTQYRVQIEISGFHKLLGTTMSSYTTATATQILNFTAVAGPEDGSVVLSFSVNGPDCQQWNAIYSAPSGKTQSVSFSGHSVTVNNLTVGTEYTFLLVPEDEALYLSGEYQISYTAQKVVYAQDLVINACGNGSLSAVWNVPEDISGLTWNVRCYNDAGYDEIITTEKNSVEFTGLDHTCGYTVTVTAVGMTQSVSASVTANPITLNTITAAPGEDGQLAVAWEFSGNAPAEGWVLTYSVDGSDPQLVTCSNNATLLPLYPDSQYEISVQPKDATTFFGSGFTYKTKPADPFEGYLVSGEDMHFYMCKTPDKEDWNRQDVAQTDFRSVFASGEKASFVVELWSEYNVSDDNVNITFIVRDNENRPVIIDTLSQVWKEMWNNSFCELDIPRIPATAGNYTVEIYFNFAYVATQNFTVT